MQWEERKAMSSPYLCSNEMLLHHSSSVGKWIFDLRHGSYSLRPQGLQMQAFATGSSNVGHLVVESRSTAAAVIEKQSFGKNEAGKGAGNRRILVRRCCGRFRKRKKMIDTLCDWRI